MPLDEQSNDLVLPSVDCQTIAKKIEEDASLKSKAYYLAGPYTTGKTNTLYQLYRLMTVKGYTSLWIDADHGVGRKVGNYHS